MRPMSTPVCWYVNRIIPHLPKVLSERRCLMIEGSARLRDIDILYRSGLYPLSHDGIAIDHVLGAANYRPLRSNEDLGERPSFELNGFNSGVFWAACFPSGMTSFD